MAACGPPPPPPPPTPSGLHELAGLLGPRISPDPTKPLVGFAENKDKGLVLKKLRYLETET